MEIRRLLDFLKTAEQLKCNTRHSYTSSGRLESVAEHSWRLALMAMLVGDEFPEMDMDKVIKMCLIHDMGEAITGDIPAFEKFRNEELIAILVMLGSATTVSSFVMARNMGHEGTLSSGVIMMTTLLSAFTLTMWLDVLRSFGLV